MGTEGKQDGCSKKSLRGVPDVHQASPSSRDGKLSNTKHQHAWTWMTKNQRLMSARARRDGRSKVNKTTEKAGL